MSKSRFNPFIKLRGSVKQIIYTSKSFFEKVDENKTSNLNLTFTTNIFDNINESSPITTPNWDIDGGIYFGFQVYHFNIGHNLYKCEQFLDDGYPYDELTYRLDDNKLIVNSKRWGDLKNISFYNIETQLINLVELGVHGESGSFYDQFVYEYDENLNIKSIEVSEIEEKNTDGGYWNVIGETKKDEFKKIILFTYQTNESIRKRYYNKDGFVFDECINFDCWGFVSNREIVLLKSKLNIPIENISFIKEFVSNLEFNDGKKIYSEFYSYSNFDIKGNWLKLAIERHCFNVNDFFKGSIHETNFQEKIIVNRKIDYHK